MPFNNAPDPPYSSVWQLCAVKSPPVSLYKRNYDNMSQYHDVIEYPAILKLIKTSTSVVG